MPRPRSAEVKREHRVCPVHGVTEFAQHIGGHEQAEYRCMACSNDQSREYHRQVRAGERVVTPRNGPPKPRPSCPTCHMELPSCGVCGDCD